MGVVEDLLCLLAALVENGLSLGLTSREVVLHGPCGVRRLGFDRATESVF